MREFRFTFDRWWVWTIWGSQKVGNGVSWVWLLGDQGEAKEDWLDLTWLDLILGCGQCPCPRRFLGIIGRDPGVFQVQPVTYLTSFSFSSWIDSVDFINFSKLVGSFLKFLNMILNYQMMVERYPNLKDEVGGSIPGYEISSLLDGKLVKWSAASYALALACQPFVSKKNKKINSWTWSGDSSNSTGSSS